MKITAVCCRYTCTLTTFGNYFFVNDFMPTFITQATEIMIHAETVPNRPTQNCTNLTQCLLSKHLASFTILKYSQSHLMPRTTHEIKL